MKRASVEAVDQYACQGRYSMGRLMRAAIMVLAAILLTACAGDTPRALTFAGSAVGREAEVLRAQLARFQERHPDTPVDVRATPDAADTRHQLYVQWLNAHATDPDILQLDVIWTAEFAAAGWILPLDRFLPAPDDFLPAAVAANRWRGTLYAVPWFVDVGMLYWRTDLATHPPATFEQLRAQASERRLPMGLVWQGARYEGLVTVFLEYVTAFGGQILDATGQVVVDSEPAIRALEEMRDAIYLSGTVPAEVLGWQEEHTRFAFQNGRAQFMRNWPYAVALLRDTPQSHVAGKFGIAPMPAGPGGTSAATLGGAQLAINARSDRADDAYAVIAFLLEPEQMIERARVVGQYPSRSSLYDGDALQQALGVRTDDLRAVLERAVPRPVTPVYSELSEVLQIHLHRALTRQSSPREALRAAAAAMRAILQRSGLAGGGS
jgi:multiple sugar transport system substrate-binding protein